MANDEIQHRLEEAFAASGLTQAALSRASGIDRSSISLYLSGRYKPKADKLLRLAAAVDTSTRTAHDLDEMIGSFTGFDLFKQLSCVSKTGGDGYLNFQTCYRISSFLDAFHAADVGEVQIL